MRHIHRVSAASVAAINAFMTIASTAPASANASLGLESAVASQQPENQLPLVSIASPSYLTTVTADVQVDVKFSPDAIADSFTARINGKDVTAYFSPSGRCSGSSACQLHGVIPQTDLLQGLNTLMLDVNGPNESAGTARTQLLYQPVAVTGADTSEMIPSIAIKSVNLPQGADKLDYRSYQIVLGPGPGFSPVIYTAANLNCSAGLNSMQVLALERQGLHPDAKVGNGTGQACLGDASSLTTFLQSIPAGDLVIVNSFLGVMSNLNTTGMGGSNFAAKPLPYYYTAIGVAGAGAGTAYESYRTDSTSGGLVPLVGSLNLDNSQHYFYTPGEFIELNVKPAGQQTGIKVRGTEYSYPLPAGAKGGFVLLTLDRHSGAVVDHYILPTNGASPEASRRAINDLTYLLNTYYNRADQLQIIATEGIPFDTNTVVPAALLTAIDTRGGNGYLLPQLTRNDSSYTLIGSKDPKYVQDGYVLETSTAQNALEATGEVDALLSRDKTNQFVLQAGLGGSLPGQSVGYQWSEVVFGQPQDWPKWTPGQQAMYADLTAAHGRYPSIRAELGCEDQCQPIRRYYGGGVGGTGAAPRVVNLNYGNLKYVTNEQYTAEDFDAVIRQLTLEAAYEHNVYTLYSLFIRVTADQQSTLQQALESVANNIDSSLASGNGYVGVNVDRLANAASVSRLLMAIPGAGAPFGALSAALKATANFFPVSNGVPDPSEYVFTLDMLRNKAGDAGKQMGDSIDTMFTGIVNDWGKLSVIGKGYAALQTPWYMSTTCRGCNVPRAAMPAIALGAKRSFYSQLLPTVYSTDVFYGEPGTDVRKIAGLELIGQGTGFSICAAKYHSAPAGGIWNYANAEVPATHDIFVLTRTDRARTGTGYYVLSFPSPALLDALFSPPTVENGTDPKVAGGAGLLRSQFGTNYPNLRAGYIPGKRCTP